MIEKLINYITESQQSNGGFGYYKTEGAMIEATSYCLMALNAYNKNIKALQKGTEFLLSLQNNNGGWLLFPKDNLSSPFATGLAIITLKNINSEKYIKEIAKGIKYLETVEGFNTTESMDENAWGWNKKGFISIEPTAYSVISMRMMNSKNKKRIQQGIKFFTDNICQCGGWTYGYPIDTNNLESTNVFYNSLKSQMHITALVLIASKGYTDPKEGIDYLLSEYTKSYCPLSLAISILALHCYKTDCYNIIKRLNDLMKKDNYLREIPFYNALTVLANLTTRGNNPLCLTV